MENTNEQAVGRGTISPVGDILLAKKTAAAKNFYELLRPGHHWA